MRRIIYVVIASLLLVSCGNELVFEIETENIPICLNDELNLTDGVIIGEKLRNPYSIEVMKQACDMLYPPTRGEDPVSDSLIVPNVKYVRFLPTDSVEYRLLMDSDLELFNYPLDYDILGDPSDYHDPNLPPEQITWQYTVMPIEQTPPINRVEVLGTGYVPDVGSSSLYDLAAIERCANNMVVNEFTVVPFGGTTNTPPPTTSTAPPTGKIRIYDTNDTDEKVIKGVKGVKVRARHFFKIRTAYTDEDGHYNINMRDFEDVNPRFELRFENRFGFKLGYNVELIMPQTYNMGSTRTFTFRSRDKEEDYKAWVLCTINNAAYDWYKRCEVEGMPTPPSDLYIWAMEMVGGAACPMLHHGTFNTSGLSIVPLATFLFGSGFGLITNAWLSILINTIAPDVFVFGVDKTTTSDLYRSTSHELAHATHFQQVGEEALDRAFWWADVINYEVTCGVLNGGGSPYAHPSLEKNEKVGITEMWAHAVGYIMLYEYIGDNRVSYPFSTMYWFKPEIIWDLYKAGMSLKDISQSMTEDITTRSSFKTQLIKDNPLYASQIQSIFN